MSGIVRRGAAAAGVVIYLLLVWAPLAGLFVAPLAVPRSELFDLLLPGPRRALVIIQTLAFGVAVAGVTTTIGTLAALYSWRRGGRLSTAARWTALLMAPIPPYLHALAWLPLCSALPGRGAGDVTGWFSATWVQSLALLPFCFGIALSALASFDPRTVEAARVFGDDRRVLLRVLLPLLRPAVVASASLALLLTLADYSVPSLFSRSTYAMEVFEEFSANHNVSHTALAAAPLVLAGMVILIPLWRMWRSAAQRPAITDSQLVPLNVPGAFGFLLRGGCAVILLPALALTTTLLRQLRHPSAWTQSLSSGAGDLATSVYVALLVAVAVCIPALAVSKTLVSRPAITWWLVAVPLAIPSALSGVGLIWLWNRDLPLPLYGTFWMLVLASLARLTPLAVLAVAAWRSRLDSALLDAAAVFLRPTGAFLLVEVPLLFPGMAVGAAAVFTLSLAELGATVLVVPPGSGTLALRIYNYLHYGASGSVAALACCMMIATAGTLLIAARLWKTRQ